MWYQIQGKERDLYIFHRHIVLTILRGEVECWWLCSPWEAWDCDVCNIQQQSQISCQSVCFRRNGESDISCGWFVSTKYFCIISVLDGLYPLISFFIITREHWCLREWVSACMIVGSILINILRKNSEALKSSTEMHVCLSFNVSTTQRL